MKELSIEIKKSVFYCRAEKVTDDKQLEIFISDMKSEHKKASHICYAAKYFENGREIIKLSDDKEPKFTAGKPMLAVIEKKGASNVAVVVARYFGGVKLGAGGLFRAYTSCASKSLEAYQNGSY